MNNEKIIDRIRKLLAMANDTSSPNEAAIAAGRARKLMDEYQITEMDLTSVQDDEFGAAVFSTGYKWRNTATGYLAIAVAELNDCVVRYVRGGGNVNIQFRGFLADAVTATEMLSYLKREMQRQAEMRVDWGWPNTRADRSAFRLGFGEGVGDQVKEIMRERRELKTSNGTELVVVKKQLVTERFGQSATRERETTTRGSSAAYQAGQRAGRNARLNRQTTGATQRRITK